MFPAPEYSCTIDGFDFILVAQPWRNRNFYGQEYQPFFEIKGVA